MLEIRQRDLDLKTTVGWYIVSTIALPVEHAGGMWYETYIFPSERAGVITSWSKVWGTRYQTKGAAMEGHGATVRDLEAGRLELYGDWQPRRWYRLLRWFGLN